MFAAVAVSSDGISKVGLSICFFLAHRKWFGYTDLVFIRFVKLLIVSGFRLRTLSDFCVDACVDRAVTLFSFLVLTLSCVFVLLW